MKAKLIPLTSEMCMAESPAPVTEIDTINLSDSSKSLNLNGAMGDNAFLTSKNFKDRMILEDKVRSYISLSVPVVNTLLTGADNGIAKKILGLSTSQFNDILSGQVIFDTYTEEYILAREAKARESYLYGGEIIEYIANNYDIEREIILEAENIIAEKFYTKKEIEKNPVTVYRSDGHGNILYDYTLCVNMFTEKASDIDTMVDWFKYDYIKNHPDSKITALLRMDESILDAFYTKTVRVLPRGLRPMIDGRSDSLTALYAEVLRADNALRKISGVHEPMVYAQKYRDLQYAFDFLVSNTKMQREERTRVRDRNRKRKSIFEYTSTKQGHIRDDMLKKVQDFSGRSVIVADPTLSLDEVRLPRAMAEKIMEFHTKIKPEKEVELREVIKHVPVILNRAPTLHRLSMRSYKVRLSDDDSIGVNPLSAEGFNFDHDGDTMAVHVPLGEDSIREMNELLDVKKNLYIPASGKVTLMPKQELVYGLNIISSSYKTPKKTKRKFDIKSDEELISVFENYDASVYALIEYKGVTKTLGEHLIDYIFPKKIVPLCKDIKKGKMSAIMEALSKEKENVFKRCADRIVKIAYTAATIYPPCISIINDYSDKASINDPFQDFEQQMSIYRESYHNGYDNSKTYNSIYTEIFEKTADKVTKNIEADMGYDNGFVRLVTCGARGNKDNLQQIVSFKGRIAKSATESFNAVITSSYLSGLSGLEHFIAAYGSRKSLIDKVRKPAETGDASRRMMHTAIDAGIVSSDCGTNEGIEINADKLTMYAQPRAINDETVEEMLASILEGRYEAGNSAEIITRAKAKELAAEMMINRKKSVIIRSPITCRDKYCSKCYGVDLTINRRAVRGLPIGAIAAQSIGEPGTQLSMRTFHKGGVSSSADITSDFDKVKAIINMVSVDVSNPQYDPIAWESGEVHIKDCGDCYSVSIGNSEKSLAFKNKPYFKKSVEKGESLSALLGSCNISEIEEYGGIKKALEYMIFSIFTIYFSQATVNLKHIEVLTSEMVKYVVVESKGGNIPIGTVLDCREYKAVEDKENYTILPKLYNSLNAPLIGENFLKGMSFSYFKDVYSAALIMGKEDSLKNAFSRIMMGLAPLTGTSYPNYLRERKEAYEEDIEIF